MNQPTDRVGEGQAGPSLKAALTICYPGMADLEPEFALANCGLSTSAIARVRRVAAALRASEATLASVQESNTIACKQLGSAEAALAEVQERNKRLVGEMVEVMKVADQDRAALAEMTKERETAREKGYDDGLRWERVYLVSCPWCGWKTNVEPISAQMTHVIACGDRRIGEERALLSASRAEATKAERREAVLVAAGAWAKARDAGEDPIDAYAAVMDALHARDDAAIRAPQPPEPETAPTEGKCPWCDMPGVVHVDPCEAPSSPPPPVTSCVQDGDSFCEHPSPPPPNEETK